jgi:hypothetical protein
MRIRQARKGRSKWNKTLIAFPEALAQQVGGFSGRQRSAKCNFPKFPGMRGVISCNESAISLREIMGNFTRSSGIAPIYGEFCFDGRFFVRNTP